MWLSLKCSRLSFRRNTVSFICVSQENICFILIVHSHELAMVREHVCPTDPESCAGGSRSSCQGHPSQTVQKVKARQSTVQTLLPCKMAGDSQRLWKQTWKNVCWRQVYCAQDVKGHRYAKNYSTVQLSLICHFNCSMQCRTNKKM